VQFSLLFGTNHELLGGLAVRNEAVLRKLRDDIARVGTHSRGGAAVLSFGVGAIDSALPHEGLDLASLLEIAGGASGALHGAAAILFAAGIAARTSGQILWCITRPDLFAPALAQAGLDPDRIIIVEAGTRPLSSLAANKAFATAG
jgi:protein ImuA